MLELPLPLEYIVMLGNGGEGGSIPKCHHRPALVAGATVAADARCVYTLRGSYIKRWIFTNFLWSRFFRVDTKLPMQSMLAPKVFDISKKILP